MDSGASTPAIPASAQHERGTSDPKKLRLFAAVDLGDAVCARAAEALESVRHFSKNAKWAHAEGFHLTLFFFGWVESEKVPAIESALARAAAAHGPMQLSVRGSGTFGSAKKPRVLWLGLAGQIGVLAALQKSVSDAVAEIGFVPEDRPFAPHFTLARARDPRGDPGLLKARDALAGLECGEGEVKELRLYRSELSPKGAHYTVWRAFPLSGGSGV